MYQLKKNFVALILLLLFSFIISGCDTVQTEK